MIYLYLINIFKDLIDWDSADSLLAAVLVVATLCAPPPQTAFVGEGHKVLRPLKRLRDDSLILWYIMIWIIYDSDKCNDSDTCRKFNLTEFVLFASHSRQPCIIWLGHYCSSLLSMVVQCEPKITVLSWNLARITMGASVFIFHFSCVYFSSQRIAKPRGVSRTQKQKIYTPNNNNCFPTYQLIAFESRSILSVVVSTCQCIRDLSFISTLFTGYSVLLIARIDNSCKSFAI